MLKKLSNMEITTISRVNIPRKRGKMKESSNERKTEIPSVLLSESVVGQKNNLVDQMNNTVGQKNNLVDQLNNSQTIEALRYKMKKFGRRTLTELELLMLVLNYRGSRKYHMDECRQLLSRYENRLEDFSQISLEEVLQIEGMTESQGIMLMALWELSNRKWTIQEQRTSIRNSGDVKNILRHYLMDLSHEEFYVLYLNRANRVIKLEQLSKGGLSATVVDVKLMMRQALLLKASTLILAHNHPSGNLRPSEEDLQLTAQIKKACKYFDLKLLDHLIFGGKEVMSFADDGLL
jgi:DNA repair protein RadC